MASRLKGLAATKSFHPKEFVMTINTYLFFNGNCQEAFKFYEKVLGGKIQDMLPHAGTPAESASRPNGRTSHACQHEARR